MTLAEVVQAKQALEADGTYPSADAVLSRLGFGSKRDVVRFMQELARGTRRVAPVVPAREAARQAAQDEFTLVEQHTALKAKRRQLDAELQTLEQQKPLLAASADQERRRRGEALMKTRSQVEAERIEIERAARAASHRRIDTETAFREAKTEADRWLRTMRYHKAQAVTMKAGWAKGDELAMMDAARNRLPALISEELVSRLECDDKLTVDDLLGEG